MPHGGAHAHDPHSVLVAAGHNGDRLGLRFALGVALNLGFVVLEATYGVLANSLSLLADAGHNLSDVLGLVLAWVATILARRQPTGRRTYGLRKSTVMASLANAVLLLVVSGALGWEAVRRFAAPEPVAETEVMVVAAIGVVINGATALLFAAGRERDLNIRGAFLHMAADAGISLGVVLSALAILATGWLWLDPATSLVIVAVIAMGTWSLLRDSLDLALDAVPAGHRSCRGRSLSRRSLRGNGGARPAHLGDEHDRGGAHRSPRPPRRRHRRCMAGRHHRNTPASLRHPARHDPGGKRRRSRGLSPGTGARGVGGR